MLLVVQENPYNVITAVIDKVRQNFRNSSIKYVHRKTKKDVIDSFNKPPLFNSGWLIICSSSVPARTIKTLVDSSAQNIVYIQTSTKSETSDLKEKLFKADIEYTFVDNYVVSESDLINYCMTELPISSSNAQYLVRRHNAYVKDVVESVNRLKFLPTVERAHINNYTEKTLKFGLYDVFTFLIDYSDEKRCTYKDAVAVVYAYRYGIKYLRKYLIKSFEEIKEVFLLAETGQLTIKNYKEVKTHTSNKMLKELTENRIKYYLTLFNSCSTEYLDYMKHLLEKCSTGYWGACDIIKILQLREAFHVSTKPVFKSGSYKH